MTDEAKKTTDQPVDRGERPDLGRTHDHLSETLDGALTGTNGGSDTRAGSLRGGSASGSDIDPDQEAIDRVMTTTRRMTVCATQDASVPGRAMTPTRPPAELRI